MKSLQSLRTLLQKLPARLEALPTDSVEVKPAGSWSAKEDLGHLLDSAANNHQRIVRAQLEDNPAMPGYDGPAWAALHAYQKRDWHELIGAWGTLNRQLLAAGEAVPDSAWSRTCTIGGSEPLTLQFVFEDYLHHMREHLQHMKVAVDDLE
jgi:DinB superfamily